MRSKKDKLLRKIRFYNNTIERLKHRTEWLYKLYNAERIKDMQEGGGDSEVK